MLSLLLESAWIAAEDERHNRQEGYHDDNSCRENEYWNVSSIHCTVSSPCAGTKNALGRPFLIAFTDLIVRECHQPHHSKDGVEDDDDCDLELSLHCFANLFLGH